MGVFSTCCIVTYVAVFKKWNFFFLPVFLQILDLDTTVLQKWVKKKVFYAHFLSLFGFADCTNSCFNRITCDNLF